MTAREWLFLVVVTCLLISGCGTITCHLISGCGTTLHVLNAETTRSMLPWLEDQPTKSIVLEKLGDFWKYADSSGRIRVYSMVDRDGNFVVWKHPGELPTHELVLVFDENERLKRYSIIKLN